MDASPAPHHESSVVNVIERKLSPGMLLLIAILAMVFFIFGLLNLLVQSLLRRRRRARRRLRRGAGEGSPTALHGQLGQLFHLHDGGVDQTFIDALPVFPYRAVAVAGPGRPNNKDPSFDCAVCLCEFGADDELRLLPTCGHAFHVPCIDAWLLSHSTCPLCRGSVLSRESAAPFALVLESSDDDGADPGHGDDGEASPKESPKAEEEIVEVKLGKLRCVDGGNDFGAGDLAADDGTMMTSGNGSNGRANLGQRRCLSMGSYEYVMDDRAALRVAVKTTPARSKSRRRHALSSECDDFGGSNSKKGAWEAAVTEAAAASGAVDGAGRRAASFRWPAMASGRKKHEHLSMHG